MITRKKNRGEKISWWLNLSHMFKTSDPEGSHGQNGNPPSRVTLSLAQPIPRDGEHAKGYVVFKNASHQASICVYRHQWTFNSHTEIIYKTKHRNRVCHGHLKNQT